MKNFIKSNKAIIFIFLFFLLLTLLSGLYLKKAPNENKTVKQNITVENQDLAFKEAPGQPEANKTITDSVKTVTENKPSPATSSITPENTAASAKSTSTETVSPIRETGQKNILYIGEKKYEIFLSENSTAYDLMDGLKKRGDIDFNGKNSPGLGFFVEEINGVKNSPKENTFWIYYINGQAAEAGISSYIVKTNDIITWKYSPR